MQHNVMGALRDVARIMIELKATANQNSRSIRQVLFLITKIVKQQPVNEHELEHEEVLAQYIPCESIRDLQDLDRKLQSDADFFIHSASSDQCFTKK